MAPHHDHGVQYAKNMAHFGCGVAMFQPVSAADMRPPCVGYIDGNNRWNFIANVEWAKENGELQGNFSKTDADEGGYQPLERTPMKMEQLGIEWRPRTSIGVRQWTVDANGQTPYEFTISILHKAHALIQHPEEWKTKCATIRSNVGLPLGADAHIKYKSNTSFGAVLIAHAPITLISYNDETLFHSWLRTNSARLSLLHGHQLRCHGLWLVTRTYTTPRASINAWDAKDKEANMSVKAKANMMGELGGDLEWTEKGSDKDWSHYSGRKEGDTVVVFFDGIEVHGYKWWWENIKGKVGRGDEREASRSRAQSTERRKVSVLDQSHMNEKQPSEEDELIAGDLWGSETALRRGSLINEFDERSGLRGRRTPSWKSQSPARNMSTPTWLTKYLAYEPHSPPAHQIDSTWARTRKSKSVATPTLTPTQRFSTASTATSTSSDKAREHLAIENETPYPTSVPGTTLYGKTA